MLQSNAFLAGEGPLGLDDDEGRPHLEVSFSLLPNGRAFAMFD